MKTEKSRLDSIFAKLDNSLKIKNEKRKLKKSK